MVISYDIPDPSSIEVVADWIELCISVSGEGTSKTEVAAAIRSSQGDEPGGAFISDVWNELERRLDWYGAYPPYEVDPFEIIPLVTLADNPSYVFCLILSLQGNPIQPTATGKLFERLCDKALKSYLDGETLTFGYPGTITVAELCRRTGERFKLELPATSNDRGLDVVGWKPLDKRGNQIIVFMQCAGGKNWHSKTSDVQMRAWAEEYVGFYAKPVRAFATPIVLSNPNLFRDVSWEADLLFDRPRIYNHILQLPLADPLIVEIDAWCQDRLIEMLN